MLPPCGPWTTLGAGTGILGLTGDERVENEEVDASSETRVRVLAVEDA